jgi:hypothetical protein
MQGNAMDQVVNKLWDIETDGLNKDVVDEMLRQAELRQQAMFSASLGMDQRAAVIGAGLIAVAGALVAGGFAVSGSGADHLRAGAMFMAALIGFGAACCIWACRPQKSRFPGIEPMEWGYDRDYLNHSVLELKLGRIAKLQDEMAENEANQSVNGRALTLGLSIALLGPIVGFIFLLV